MSPIRFNKILADLFLVQLYRREIEYLEITETDSEGADPSKDNYLSRHYSWGSPHDYNDNVFTEKQAEIFVKAMLEVKCFRFILHSYDVWAERTRVSYGLLEYMLRFRHGNAIKWLYQQYIVLQENLSRLDNGMEKKITDDYDKSSMGEIQRTIEEVSSTGEHITEIVSTKILPIIVGYLGAVAKPSKFGSQDIETPALPKRDRAAPG